MDPHMESTLECGDDPSSSPGTKDQKPINSFGFKPPSPIRVSQMPTFKIVTDPLDKFTKGDIIQALDACGGFMNLAANMLGISYKTLVAAVDADPEIKATIQCMRESRLDIAEEKLLELVKLRDFNAIKYLLDNQGKERGYGPKNDSQAPDSVSVSITTINAAINKISSVGGPVIPISTLPPINTHDVLPISGSNHDDEE